MLNSGFTTVWFFWHGSHFRLFFLLPNWTAFGQVITTGLLFSSLKLTIYLGLLKKLIKTCGWDIARNWNVLIFKNTLKILILRWMMLWWLNIFQTWEMFKIYWPLQSPKVLFFLEFHPEPFVNILPYLLGVNF